MSRFGFASTGDEVVQAFPDQVKGRTFLVTGASAGGLGAHATIAVARAAPAHIILVGRTKAKIDPVINEIASINSQIKTTFVACELSDFDSVRKAAAQINDDASIQHIDVVLNNAGVMAIKDYTLDKQGYELTLSANHLGHFLLTNLVMSKIKAAGPNARVVNVTSLGHRIGPVRFSDYNFSNGADYDGWSAYGQSKTANILFSLELARRGIKSYSVHPGAIFDTNLANHLEMKDFDDIAKVSVKNNGKVTFAMEERKTTAQGIAPYLTAMLDPALDEHPGVYILDSQIADSMDYAADPENGKKLWELSEKLVGQSFNV